MPPDARLLTYKVPSGPYVVLPFVGPSTVRDTAGSAASYVASFWALDDWAPGYILADRTASYVTDGAPGAVTASAAGTGRCSRPGGRWR